MHILFFQVVRGLKGQKMTHNYQFQFITLYISRTADHIIKIFGFNIKILTVFIGPL